MLHILPSCLAQELISIFPLPNLDQSATTSQYKYISYCFHLQSMSSSLTWKVAYAADKDTSIIIQYLIYHQLFEKDTLSSLPAQYCSTIANNNRGIVEGRLVFYEIVMTITNKICRIVVPISLRQTMLSLLHASPAAGHMGEYKTLYSIKVRFF